MSWFSRVFRNIFVLITLTILTIAVFLLVSRRVEIQPIILTTSQPSLPPTSTPESEPTITPFTPEVVMGTVTLITPPPPPPTISSGDLAEYRLEQTRSLPVNRENQTVLGGWTSDGQSLFTYSLINAESIRTQNQSELQSSIVTLLPIIQDYNLNSQALSVTTLSSLVNRNAKFYPEPIKKFSNIDAFIYRENLADNRFNLWISNLDGSQQKLLVETDTPVFATSIDGYLLYVNQNYLRLVKPSLNQSQNLPSSSVALDDLGLNIANVFRLALSLNGKNIAIYDKNGHFYIIDNTRQTVLNLSLKSDMEVRETAWSPDGLMLAYTIGSNSGELRGGGNFLILREIDKGTEQIVKYESKSVADSIGLYDLRWSPNNQILAVIGSPYSQCNDCRDTLIFISRNGQNIKEIEKEEFLGILEWNPTGDKIAYLCIRESHKPAQVCVSSVVNN